ncbi:MAG TPA: biotin/lipoyl-containing protein [Acidobacteriaceae bacterium]
MSLLAVDVEVDGVVHKLALERRDEGWMLQMDGRFIPVDLTEPMPGVLSLLIDDGDAGVRSYRCVRTECAGEETIAVGSEVHRVTVSDPRSLRGQRRGMGAANGALQIKASMPGRIARVLVKAGETVKNQQGVVVIEAMKMQNELKATRDGRVAELRVAAGDKVSAGQVLAVIE